MQSNLFMLHSVGFNGQVLAMYATRSALSCHDLPRVLVSGSWCALRAFLHYVNQRQMWWHFRSALMPLGWRPAPR
uniref:Uncharacterized protein n=1 Tax=Anguilla anguilla TaxID=7936 RepID=A0A0E9QYQ5_ANGAN